MDWLEAYHAIIDCCNKIVTLCPLKKVILREKTKEKIVCTNKYFINKVLNIFKYLNMFNVLYKMHNKDFEINYLYF